jgi:hypothetical protein
MLEIKISKKSNPKQRISNQGIAKMAPSTIKTTEFNVRLEISLENKIYPKNYYHHSKLILKWMKHQLKLKCRIFK